MKKGDAAAYLCAHRSAVVIEVERSHDKALTRVVPLAVRRQVDGTVWSSEQGLHFFHGLFKADENGPRNNAVPDIVFDDFRNMG